MRREEKNLEGEWKTEENGNDEVLLITMFSSNLADGATTAALTRL